MDDEKPSQNKGELKVGSDEQKQGKEIEVNEKKLPSKAAAIHELIRLDGEKELERDSFALLWSAIAAGLSMGASLIVKVFSMPGYLTIQPVFYWEMSVIPSVLSLLSWRVSSYLLRILSPLCCPSCKNPV